MTPATGASPRSTAPSTETATIGRPVVTSHEEIELAAFRLFEQRGFARTTVDAIAAEVGVSKRTIHRYYASKNDIAWGRFSDTLAEFRRVLEQTPTGAAVHTGVHRAILAFNRFPDNAHPTHRSRMRLILRTPELQAHSVLQYAEWRQVIAEHVAARTGTRPGDLLPQVAGNVSLALSLSAYEHWLDDECSGAAGLLDYLNRAMASLRAYLQA